jgi:hypothetical protein
MSNKNEQEPIDKQFAQGFIPENGELRQLQSTPISAESVSGLLAVGRTDVRANRGTSQSLTLKRDADTFDVQRIPHFLRVSCR